MSGAQRAWAQDWAPIARAWQGHAQRQYAAARALADAGRDGDAIAAQQDAAECAATARDRMERVQ